LRYRHIPVVEQGRLCGIISIGDILKTCLDDSTFEIDLRTDAYLADR
jgi:CBS domain-containing protein